MKAIGLEGIVVAETALSLIDGAGGELIVGGHRLAELCEEASIGGLATLLWAEPVTSAELGAARVRAHTRVASLGGALDCSDGMGALQAMVAQLPSSSSARDIVGGVAVFAAAWHRHQRGLETLEPDPSLEHGKDTLRLVTGADPGEARGKALDRYLVTVADHGVNASTFAARVVTSTGASALASVVAAIGALSGPLHGGAPGPVLDMLDAAGPDPRPWLEAELAAGRRIMGMGHRVYRARDPRAAVLEQAVIELEREGIETRLTAARRLEACAQELLLERHPERALRANVELYTAVLLDALGLPRSMFAPTFAVGRVVGWLGHCREQAATSRLIRPSSAYIGPMPGAAASSR